MPLFPNEYIFEKQVYTKIKDRDYTDVAIYENADSVLRLGLPGTLERDRSMHQLLENYSFPVPRLYSYGQTEDYEFTLEQKFVGEHLGRQMKQETEAHGSVSEPTFQLMCGLIHTHADAQRRSIDPQKNTESSAHIQILLQELPELEEKIQEVLSQVQKRLSTLPAVLTHGDFNPHNIFPEGFIDFEYMSYAPFGEDITNPLYHIYFFPESSYYEYSRGYAWSYDQQTVLKKMYRDYQVLDFINEFILLRSVFATVRMDATPKLQLWRYELFKALLHAYARKEELFPLLTTFPSTPCI